MPARPSLLRGAGAVRRRLDRLPVRRGSRDVGVCLRVSDAAEALLCREDMACRHSLRPTLPPYKRSTLPPHPASHPSCHRPAPGLCCLSGSMSCSGPSPSGCRACGGSLQRTAQDSAARADDTQTVVGAQGGVSCTPVGSASEARCSGARMLSQARAAVQGCLLANEGRAFIAAAHYVNLRGGTGGAGRWGRGGASGCGGSQGTP